jgi:hypothetical protein
VEFTNAECLGTLILQKEVIKQLSIYKPVRDNRKIHHISSRVISPKILSVANLSCHECDECLFDDNTKCTNSEYCGERRVLQMEYMNRKERDSNDYMYENESVSDLVTIGSVVAVLADDDEYDYYLMKVSKVPFQLERVEQIFRSLNSLFRNKQCISKNFL